MLKKLTANVQKQSTTAIIQYKPLHKTLQAQYYNIVKTYFKLVSNRKSARCSSNLEHIHGIQDHIINL